MKYIIELEDVPFRARLCHAGEIVTLWKAKGFNSLVFDKNGLEKLTPLNDIEDLQSSAYQRGFEAGFREGRTRRMLSEGHNE